MNIVIVTGLAGAGKSTALRALEDVGYFCVDNVPVPLLSELTTQLGSEIPKLAVAIDARQKQFLSHYHDVRSALIEQGHEVEVLYLEADDDMLLRRYSETRRRHPMSGENVRDGIATDREALVKLRDGATLLDTTALNVHQLKGIIQERYSEADGKLNIILLSFGFKHGIPKESDLVFDVRFLPNPYFEESLSKLDGREKRVADYVLKSPQGAETYEKLRDFLLFACPHYETEGKRYLTIAIGCTGGRHRSVASIEKLSAELGSKWPVKVRHRDLARSGDV